MDIAKLTDFGIIGIVLSYFIWKDMRTFETYKSLSDYDDQGNLITIYYPIGTTKTLTSSEATSEQGMRIQKQLTKTTYRRIDIRNFHAVSIVRADKPRGKDLSLKLNLQSIKRLDFHLL